MFNPTLLTLPFKLDKRSTNGFTCQLHHTYTRLLFLFSFAMSTYRQLTVSGAILCNCPEFKNEEFCNVLCLTNGTYTLTNESLFATSVDAEREYHRYYQFVPIVFLLQVVSFGLPNLFWEHVLSNHSIPYYYKYLFIKLVFLAHLVAHDVLLREFVGKDRFTNGNFPLYSRCEFVQMASSDVNKYSVFCLLPLNVLYSKIFPVVCGWLSFLFVASVTNLSFRLALLIAPLRIALYGERARDLHRWFQSESSTAKHLIQS
jgi:hypothetical protein